jgi:hypothetical protein
MNGEIFVNMESFWTVYQIKTIHHRNFQNFYPYLIYFTLILYWSLIDLLFYVPLKNLHVSLLWDVTFAGERLQNLSLSSALRAGSIVTELWTYILILITENCSFFFHYALDTLSFLASAILVGFMQTLFFLSIFQIMSTLLYRHRIYLISQKWLGKKIQIITEIIIMRYVQLKHFVFQIF